MNAPVLLWTRPRNDVIASIVASCDGRYTSSNQLQYRLPTNSIFNTVGIRTTFSLYPSWLETCWKHVKWNVLLRILVKTVKFMILNKTYAFGPFHTHAKYSREHSRSSFGLSIHTHANANVRTNCSREQFASFALSNAIRANNWRINPIFDYFLLTICGRPEVVSKMARIDQVIYLYNNNWEGP